MTDIKYWEEKFEEYWSNNESDDASHDIGHFRRVWRMADRIANKEEGNPDRLVLITAAYFHDLVNPPKNSDLRSKASKLAAEKSVELLKEMNFPIDKLDNVYHAIEAHSFSANIKAKTIEAKILQDADRMESLGAMGIARNMYVAGKINSSMFHPEDIMAENRELNDSKYAIDHYPLKLLKLPEMMQTKTGKEIAIERAEYIIEFRTRLIDEIEGRI